MDSVWGRRVRRHGDTSRRGPRCSELHTSATTLINAVNQEQQRTLLTAIASLFRFYSIIVCLYSCIVGLDNNF